MAKLSIDPITLEIVQNALSSIADELALVIMRAAYSNIVRDSMDYSTAVCDFGDVSWTSATFTANACLIYNSSASNKAVCSVAFGGDKSVSSGTFTIQFPTAGGGSELIRLG